MKYRCVVSITIMTALLFCSRLLARPTTSYQAQQVVTGWLKADSLPLGATLGQTVSEIEIFRNDNDEAVYYVVYLKPSGFVIVSADDVIEPIIGFADDGTFDSSFENPLWSLVHNDLNGRIAAIRDPFEQQAKIENSVDSFAQSKWAHFINLAESDQGELSLMGLVCLSDIRVVPFIKTQWGQSTVCSENCFNYYSPNHYSCGCLATAMAQLMRHYEYPSSGIGRHEFMVTVDGKEQTLSTLGGDGSGGPYDWSRMVLKPQLNCETLTEEQKQAIGALCYDAGIAIHMQYASDGSGAHMADTMTALVETFMYSNAIMGYNSGSDIGSGLSEMINPSLDAKIPVILGLEGNPDSENGHAVLCDGYGYESSTLYHHLNMGWNGVDDAWYNLPAINAHQEFNTITTCLYNIYISGAGEIISGRVLDTNGNPIANAQINASSAGRTPLTALTDYRGIYALKGLSSNSSYRLRVEKEGYVFSSRSITTGSSHNGEGTSGNRWEIDLNAVIVLTPPPLSSLFVDDNAPGDPGPGDSAISDSLEDGSPDHPFDTIQEAIDMAAPGETVIVMQGTYIGNGNRDLDLRGKPITVRSIDPNDPAVVAETIIDCNASNADPHCGFIFQNYETSQSIVAGLTFTGGNHLYGGIIFSGQCASPKVINCIFRENKASYGGAIYIDNSSPILINCQFFNNSADAGGAIYCFGEGTGCNPFLTDCTFIGNMAEYNGGAIYNSGEVHSTFTNCIFTENISSGGGGAIRNISSANPSFKNCIFSKNEAESFGGGIRNSKNSNVTLTNCTFSENSAEEGNSLACTADDDDEQSSSSVQIINCIIHDSGNEIWNGDYSTITITYSNVPNRYGSGPWLGEGNIFADPFFADADNGDFHLQSQTGRFDPNTLNWVIDELTSPCIDAGDINNPVADEPQPNGGIINMGAYGGTSEASKSYFNQGP